MIERARGAAIQLVSPILLDLLSDPEAALQKYLGITTLVPPLTSVEQMGLQTVEDLFRSDLTTPLDQLALSRALDVLAMKPSDLLDQERTALITSLLYGPKGLIESEAMNIASQYLGSIPSSPVMKKALEGSIIRGALDKTLSDVATIKNVLESQQRLRDVYDWISAIQTLDKLQATAADVARSIGGTSGLLQTMTKASEFAAFPRVRELQERSAYEDILKQAIETSLGLMRIQPAGKTTVQTTEGPGVLESGLSSFVQGLGTGLGWYFMNKPISPATYTSPLSTATGYTLSPTLPSWATYSTTTYTPYTGFSLGASLPSWAGSTTPSISGFTL